LFNSEVNPTRCNNCVYSSQWLYSTCFGWQFDNSPLLHLAKDTKIYESPTTTDQ